MRALHLALVCLIYFVSEIHSNPYQHGYAQASLPVPAAAPVASPVAPPVAPPLPIGPPIPLPMHIPWPVPFFKSKYDKYEKKSDSYNNDDDEYEEDDDDGYDNNDDSYYNRGGSYGRGYNKRRSYGQQNRRNYGDRYESGSKYGARSYNDDGDDEDNYENNYGGYDKKEYGRPRVFHDGSYGGRLNNGGYDDSFNVRGYKRRDNDRRTYGMQNGY